MSKVFLLGDSTCAAKADGARPETGWGEMFSPYLAEGWSLRNLAVNGRSTRMILLEGIFYDCFWEAEEGDWVIIQFGHNENKPEDYRRTEPYGSFTFNLCYMVDNLAAKGVSCVLASPISRRRFVDGHVQNTHFDYPEAMEAVARQMGIPFVEMTRRTLGELERMGEEESLKWFMNFPAGVYPNYPEGDEDNTHLRPEGAKAVARMMYEGLRDYNLPFLKKDQVPALQRPAILS